MKLDKQGDSTQEQGDKSVQPAATSVVGANEMRANLAVLLDEYLQHGGEMQIKRAKRGRGSRWELVVWEPTGGKYPRVRVRLSATTALELVSSLDALALAA